MSETVNDIWNNTRSSIYAIYDYSFSPVTFDFLQFAEMAEVYRTATKKERIHFNLVLGPGDGFRSKSNKDRLLSRDEKLWRVRQIHMPSCWLVDSCSSVSLFLDRHEALRHLQGVPAECFFHPTWSPTNPLTPFIPAQVLEIYTKTKISPLVLKATPQGLHYADEWIAANHLDASKIVVLTLRNSKLETYRNARYSDWFRFAETIAAEGYQPVFVPDTDEAIVATREDYQTRFPTFWTGPVNLELRTGLYERANICMSDNGAAAWVHQWMPHSNSITFQPLSKIPVSQGLHNNRNMQQESQGIARGEQFPFFTSTQWFCWGEDEYGVILEEFRKLEQAIAAKTARA